MQGKIININDVWDKKNNEKNDMEIVRKNGYLEIEEYKKLVFDFINKVSSLSMFEVIMKEVMTDEIHNFLIDEFLNNAVKPIFEGKRPGYLDVDEYDGIRRDMYANLVNRYVRKNE